eukprot:2835028-Pleurochrysis_carterae.AAC.2
MAPAHHLQSQGGGLTKRSCVHGRACGSLMLLRSVCTTQAGLDVIAPALLRVRLPRARACLQDALACSMAGSVRVKRKAAARSGASLLRML